MIDSGFTTLRTERSGAVLWVSVDQPPVNLMDRTMMSDLKGLLERLQADRQTKVVVFASAIPDFFIPHADLGLFKTPDAPPPRPQKLPFIHRLFEGYRALPQATLAMIEGRVNGAGMELALSLDMRFAALETARMGQFEVALGCIPGGTATQRLPSLLGRGRSLELVLGCDEFDGATAERYGLVNRALPAAELRPFVERLAARIASFPADAIAQAKRAVDHALGDPTPGLLEETYLAAQLMTSPEVKQRFERALARGLQTDAGERALSRILAGLGDAE